MRIAEIWGGDVVALPAHLRDAARPSVHEDLAPATGTCIAQVEHAAAEHVDAAVRAAHNAQRGWRQLGGVQRGRLIEDLADLLAEAAPELALLECHDTGNPRRAMHADVQKGINALRTYAGAALEVQGATIPASPTGLHLYRPEPWGVVGAITAYNHPLLFACLRAAAALVAGNALVLKPAEQAPLTTIAFGRLAAAVLPEGVVTVLPGAGAAGAALAAHPDVPRISFTGSTATGLMVQRAAADSGRFKALTLELGGKNPIVVFEDVDPAEAADAIVKGMNVTRVQGQSCGSTSRALVHESIHDAVAAGVAERLRALRIGLPEQGTTDVGALISVIHRDRVVAAMDEHRREGHAPLIGGGAPTGRPDLAAGAFVEPTVFERVDPAAPLATREIFGPVLATFAFANEDEAIRLANATEYGLTASVWTSDIDRALRVADAIDVGYVWVNDVETRYPGVPFGGRRQSGIGTEQGVVHEIRSYTRDKSLNVRIRPADDAAPPA